jgi:DNA-binding SARP family transcriptional activator
MRIRLLGDFEVSVGPRTIADASWRLRKAAGLIKILALAPQHRLPRGRATELVWPDSDAKTASNNLRGALHAARKALGAEGSDDQAVEVLQRVVTEEPTEEEAHASLMRLYVLSGR